MDNVKKILFITLSNIGDVVLSLPSLDLLRKEFPSAEITVMAGVRAKEIFENNPAVEKFIVYDKQAKPKDKVKLFHQLRKGGFDIIIDLRNTFLGVLLPARYKTSPFFSMPANAVHMKDKHLARAKSVFPGWRTRGFQRGGRDFLYISREDEVYITDIFKTNNISGQERVVVVSPGARSHTKRWPADKFLALISLLIEELKARVFLVGDSQDAEITKYISGRLELPVIDLAGKTGIGALAGLLKKASLVITNDSAVLHIASYLDVPVLSLFGISNELKYGPWSGISRIVKKDVSCRPCSKAQCTSGELECIKSIDVTEVFLEAKGMLLG